MAQKRIKRPITQKYTSRKNRRGADGFRSVWQNTTEGVKLAQTKWLIDAGRESWRFISRIMKMTRVHARFQDCDECLTSLCFQDGDEWPSQDESVILLKTAMGA
jgi:hypothetical protein